MRIGYLKHVVYTTLVGANLCMMDDDLEFGKCRRDVAQQTGVVFALYAHDGVPRVSRVIKSHGQFVWTARGLYVSCL